MAPHPGTAQTRARQGVFRGGWGTAAVLGVSVLPPDAGRRQSRSAPWWPARAAVGSLHFPRSYQGFRGAGGDQQLPSRWSHSGQVASGCLSIPLLTHGLHCRCWLAQARGRVLVILSSAGPWVSTSTRGPESRLSGCVGGGLQRAGACVGSCLKHAPHSSPRSWEGGAHRLAAARGPADRGRWCSPVWRSVHETVGATTAIGCAQRPVPPCGPGPVPWGLGGLAGSPWTPGHARRRRHSILT